MSELNMETDSKKHDTPTDANNVLEAGLSRVVKFRAFVETYNGKEMVNGWCFLNEKDNHFNAVDLTNERPDIGEVYSVMQYTGLKDKNGKEIYESDVVIPFSLENKMNKSVVVYEFNQFRIKGTSLYWNFDLEQIEVIGNIFENPELVVSNAVS